MAETNFLHLLPTRTGGAAENMALDFLLLQRYPDAAVPRFRHYEWRAPAVTFGFSQKIAWVRENLVALAGGAADTLGDGRLELCRRPTGGGIVDHRIDWTYALVIPRGHALYEAPATESYRLVHEALAEALGELGQEAEVSRGEGGGKQETGGGRPEAAGPGVCFLRAERYDVVQPVSGAKIAGAAQKRNKHGLLFQGSIEKSAVGAVDWEEFRGKFAAAVGRALAVNPRETGWPDLAEHEVEGLIEQYSSPEWVEYR